SSGGSSGSSGGAAGASNLAVSATMDSSAYTITQGTSVTFTARMLGNAATPTGSIAFKADGAAISGCGAATLAGGMATCTTSSLSMGAHAITGVYGGDASYSAGVAGPITQTVLQGSVERTLPSGSTNSALNVQGLWWRSSAGSESGWGVNLAQQ